MKVMLEDFKNDDQVLFEVNVSGIEEARKLFLDIKEKNDWGASAYLYFESGLVINEENTPIALIAFNGRVFEVFGKDLRDWTSHLEVKDFKEFDNKFMKNKVVLRE